MGRRGAAAVLVLALGCTVEDNSNPFGAATVATSYPTSVGTTIAATDESSSSSGEGSSDGETSSGGGEASSGGGEASSGGAVESSSSDGANDMTGGGVGMQPADGMYSSCVMPEDCGFSPTLCITIQDAMMNPLAGFCSETGCMNGGTNCDASPGGTATPMCMPVTVNNMADQACALDCSGGKTCPAPMVCRPLQGGLMVCA
jgi:hypothetical protein